MNNDTKTLTYEEYQEKVKSLKSFSDVTNFAKELIAPTLQAMLEAEMEQYLGYKKHELKGRNTGNSRNGHSIKNLKTTFGAEKLEVPRDRNSSFEPIAVRKYETVESDVEERIIAMYAKGLTTRDIHTYMKDIYGVEVSAGMVSTITDKVLPLVTEWQARPLAPTYVVVYLDGIHFKTRDSGKIINKCSYTILGINEQGHKELLGIWIGQTEGSKFWAQILNELKNRGVADILIACVDGLAGFDEAIKASYPHTQIQQCVVHQIRNTLKYIPHKHKKELAQDLRAVYTASTEEAGLMALEDVKGRWPQYALYLKSWEDKWHLLSPFFAYPPEIRRIIYTTNTIENLHRQFRKITKTTTVFPHDEALIKLLWLAQEDISKQWQLPIRNWGEIIAQLVLMFPERISIN
jgi:putative transposase